MGTISYDAADHDSTNGTISVTAPIEAYSLLQGCFSVVYQIDKNTRVFATKKGTDKDCSTLIGHMAQHGLFCEWSYDSRPNVLRS